MSTPFWRILSLFALPGLLTVAARAQLGANASAAPPANVSANGDSVPRIWDFFDIELPKTEGTGQINVSFQPHFRDLISKGYLRVPFDIRWGVNDNFELNSDIDTYFDHGLRKGSYGDGISELHFGAKYAWSKWLKPTWKTGIGFNSSIPVSRPPVELTDGHDHFTPYIVFERKLANTPGLSVFLNLHTDFVSSWSVPDHFVQNEPHSNSTTPAEQPKPSPRSDFAQNEPHSNSMTVTPGMLYNYKAWNFTLEVDGTTTRKIGSGSHDFLTIRPGVIRDLPKWLVFNSNGRWLAGFNLTFVFGPDGNTISTGGKLRGEVNLTQLFGRNPPSAAPSTGSAP